ncbi:secreted protein C-like isoform X6 [Montipora capricornis]|uniref:secreted protein C-like isoform X6 n=1 Tax=Montipora capricornis TaxID=246305 RepID=UPI0035F21A54
MNIRLLLACLALCLSQAVLSAPLDASQKPGEEQVKEAVKKAELDASLAAEDAVRHGHKAESRVTNDKDSSEEAEENEDDDEGNNSKRVKEHKVNRKPSRKMLGLGGFGDLGGNNNDYKEDTRLEDRLAMEAEEEKKYETGEGYGAGGGGGGGGTGWDEASKGVNWATNIQRQDAAEKQSIQAQVASESAHELDEIQRAIAAESQSSRGSASIGNAGASVVGGAGSPVQVQGGMQPRITNPEGQTRQNPSMPFVGGGQQKSLSPSESQESFQDVTSPYSTDRSSFGEPEISNFIHQAEKISPSEMRGATQQDSMGMGGLASRGSQGLSEGMGGLGGLEGAQQLGGQSQMASMEQSPMAGSERFGGAMDAGAVSQEALGQAGLAGGLSESAVSRMTDGSLGGRTGESIQGMQGMQGMQGIQSMQDLQGMQGVASALSTGQGQGGMLSDNGGVSALQGQGMMGASLQGGMQSLMGGGGGGLGGLQAAMGGGGDLGQQQMAFKKSTIARPSDLQRSKTHQRDEASNKHKKRKLQNKLSARKSALPKKHLVRDHKKSVKKSKLVKKQHSKQSRTH